MLVVITGGSGSGKSKYAEEYLMSLSQGCTRYYLATMQVQDGEGLEKVKRHQEMRSGKQFVTVEQPRGIEQALQKMKLHEQEQTANLSDRAALLECISNLTANEMFPGGAVVAPTVVAEKIVTEIQKLFSEVEHLVIVTNNVFEDGMDYDEATRGYLTAMGEINERLAAIADEVIEVVVGIPIVIKEKKDEV